MDILTYINRMNQIYGNGPAPAPRYNTQQYLQGGRVGYQDGKNVGGRPPKENPYAKSPKFQKFLKERGGLKSTERMRDVLTAYERMLSYEGKIVGVKELNEFLGKGQPYADLNQQMALANTRITKNMSKTNKAQIKAAQKIRKIVIDVIGEGTPLGDIQSEYQYIRGGTGTSQDQVWNKLSKSQVNKINKALTKQYNTYGVNQKTLKNIFKLTDDADFMKAVKNYKGGSIDINSALFKKIMQSGDGGMATAFMQLGRTMRGEIEIEGIKTDKNMGNKIIKMMGAASGARPDGAMMNATRKWSKYQIAKNFDDPNASYDNLATTIRKSLKDVGITKLDIDEIFPLRSGQLTIGKGSGAYNNFIQFIDANINAGAKKRFDAGASKRYQAIIEARKTGNWERVNDLVKAHKDKVNNFYIDNPEAKGKVKLTQLNYNPKTRKFASPTEIYGKNVLPSKIQKDIDKFYKKTGLSLDVGSTMTLEKAADEINKDPIKLLKKMGYKCNLAKGAGESVACYMDDVKKTRADMKSPNVEVRAKAFAKQSNAFKIAKKLPKIGKWLSTAFKVGKTGLSTAVGSVTGGYGGVFLEGLLEGGFYDNARRKGYSPEQAEAETFTYRLAREGLQGKSTKDVPWYGGSEKLREKELIGDPQQNPKVAQYVDALKEQDRIYEAIGAKEEAKEDLRISEENFDTLFLPGNVDEASADVQDLARSGAYRRVDQTLKPGSMASQAYNTAVENRDALDQRRRRKYLEKFNPDALKREEKILSSPKQLEKRYEAMEKYKKNKADIFGFMPRKEYEKYQKEYDELKNISYEDIPKFVSYTEFLKSKPEGYDKTYGELYPTPASRYDFDLMGDIAREGGIANMAGGGRVPFKFGGIDKGRRAFMKWLAGITGATIAGGTGLIKLGKGATKVVPKVTEEVIKRGADGTPAYIADLIKVVKAKGIKKIMDSDINKMPDTVHSYKGVDIVEDAAGEATRIRKDLQWGSDNYLVNPEIEMSVTKGKTQVTDEGLKTQKSFKEADEFQEVSVMPDRDGKMKDVDFYVDDKYHLEFEEIANEAKDLFKVKKAEGGLASYDNYLPGIDELY